jgi:hypothetical protein
LSEPKDPRWVKQSSCITTPHDLTDVLGRTVKWLAVGAHPLASAGVPLALFTKLISAAVSK